MTTDPQVVLDASALLATLHGEPGGGEVANLLESAAISSVNLSEVMQRGVARTVAIQGLREELEALGLAILPFTAEDAEAAARLWSVTRSQGLSLGDRACLALAQRLSLPAVTADRVWERLEIGVRVVLIR